MLCFRRAQLQTILQLAEKTPPSPINPDGSFTVKAPDTNPGDYIVLRAEMDAYVVVSACPQDMNDTCGGKPTDIQVEIGR